MSSTSVPSSTREFAHRLIALEASAAEVAVEDQHATCRVCEKLRRPLSTLTGPSGFASLLARALALAKREAPALASVRVAQDGSLEGLDGEAADAIPILIAHLIHLLTTFIGHDLVERLSRDIWPDLPAGALFARKDSQ